MKNSVREKFTFERVKEHFINDDKITYRDLRSDQKQAENHYWELTGQSMIQFLQSENKNDQNFDILFEKSFLRMFVDIYNSVKTYSSYFDRMVRSEFDAMNKDDQLFIFFADLHAKRLESLEKIKKKIKYAYKDGTATESFARAVHLPIDALDQHNKRIEQPISNIFKSEFFSKFVVDIDGSHHIIIYTSVDRKLVRILHSEMKKVAMYNVCTATYEIVFLPFMKNKALPYFKIENSPLCS